MYDTKYLDPKLPIFYMDILSFFLKLNLSISMNRSKNWELTSLL